MIKYFCDRCGKELNRERRIGYIAVNTRDKAEGELMDDNEFEDCHYCSSCTNDIKRFVRTIPAERAQNILENKNNVEKSEIPVEHKEADADGLKKRKNIDTGKILALRKAGWPVKEIAAEMNLSPQQVSNQIYLHKKKEEVKVLIENCNKGQMQKQ